MGTINNQFTRKDIAIAIEVCNNKKGCSACPLKTLTIVKIREMNLQ